MLGATGGLPGAPGGLVSIPGIPVVLGGMFSCFTDIDLISLFL